jgi:hypothetical protein
MGSETVSEKGGTGGTGGTLARVEAEIRTVLENRAAVEAALRGTIEADLKALGQRWHLLTEELQALRWLQARLGGGTDTDYYHRRRDRGGIVTVTNGQHSVVEDRR